MKSYTASRTLYGKLTKNTSSANLTLGDETINDEIRHLCSLKDFHFLHRTRTFLTTAGTQFKALPYDVDQVESVYVTLGTKRYVPKLLASREQWDELNEVIYQSDFPLYAYVYDGQLGLFPTPSSSGNVVTINAKIRVIDLSAADYTTGNVASVANGGTAVVGTGTTWTERMGGRWIRMSYSDTVNTGDGEWYEMSGVGSATTATLVRAYGGTAISAGTAPYTIGQMSLLPEDFQDTPVFKAAATYWYTEADSKRADSFMEKYIEDVKTLKALKTAAITDMVVDDGNDINLINPNLTITL